MLGEGAVDVREVNSRYSTAINTESEEIGPD